MKRFRLPEKGLLNMLLLVFTTSVRKVVFIIVFVVDTHCFHQRQSTILGVAGLAITSLFQKMQSRPGMITVCWHKELKQYVQNVMLIWATSSLMGQSQRACVTA